jgi:dipeptidyl aminopeptidase/acylaminoacyl peptidase
LALPLGVLVATIALTTPAQSACEVPLPGDPSGEEATCGAVNETPLPNPPGVPPKIVAWASGFDLNPLNQDRLGIYIARSDGTQRRRVAGFAAFRSLQREFSRLHGIHLPEDHPSFSPDFRKLVFTSNRADPDHNNFDVHVMNVNGSGVRRLTSTTGLDTEPVFSPDGTKIAFSTQRFGAGLDIAVMDTNGGNVRRLTSSSDDEIEPAWRPDGQEIVFSRAFGLLNKEIFVIKPDGSGLRQVTDVLGEDHDATYSPDGQQIVITSERKVFPSPPYGNVHKIRVSDGADLGDLTQEHQFGAGDPFWSRDGLLIAYFNSGGPILRAPQRLFVMGANGAGKFHIPGEAQANIHPAVGLAIDDDRDGTPNYLESASVGKTGVSPNRGRAGRTARFSFWWKHPQRWRRLDTLWLRFSRGRALLGTVRFSLRRRAFSVFDGTTNEYSPTKRRGRGRLRSNLLTLDLRRSRIVGVDRKKLKLVLALRFSRKLAGERLRIRAQADDIRGRNQEDELGRLQLIR